MLNPESQASNRMFTVQEMVTPEVAKAYLATTKINRPIVRARVTRHKQRMQQGNWVLSPHGIVFAVEGNLIDGRHRMTAQVELGLTLPYMVTRGAEDYVMAALDPAGSARTAGEWLAILGYRDGTSLAAAAGALRKIELAIEGGRYNSNLAIDPYFAQRIVEQNPQLEDYLSVGKRLNSRLNYPGGIGTAVRHLFGKIDEREAENFFHFLSTGAYLDEGNPILALQEGIMGIRKTNKYGRVDHAKAAAYTIICWNSYIRNEQRKQVKWTPSRRFPIPVGPRR